MIYKKQLTHRNIGFMRKKEDKREIHFFLIALSYVYLK